MKPRRNDRRGFGNPFRKKTPQEISEDEADEQKMASILQRKVDLPLPLRLAINKQLTKKGGLPFRQKMKPRDFLSEIEDRVAEWLAGELEDYHDHSVTSSFPALGLDDERDTHEQVELALRLFPRLLKRRILNIAWPINFLSRSIKTVSFIPLFARLGDELGIFLPNQRGGLVVYDGMSLNVFSHLVMPCPSFKDDDSKGQERADHKFLAVIKELRKANLMKKSDIIKYQLMNKLCKLCRPYPYDCNYLTPSKSCFFPRERFLYLVHWNPMALLSTTEIKTVTTVSPWLKSRFFDSNKKRNLSENYMLFDLLMKYFPKELGFIFDKPLFFDKTYMEWCRYHSHSADQEQCYWMSCFEFACRNHGGVNALSILDEFVHLQVQKDANFTRKALYRAATKCGEHGLDQIFFLIQKDPKVFQWSSGDPVAMVAAPSQNPAKHLKGSHTVSKKNVTNDAQWMKSTEEC